MKISYKDYKDYQNYLKKLLGYNNVSRGFERNQFDTLDKNNSAEVLSCVAKLIGADCRSQCVKCKFENEYFEGNSRSDKFFIFGQGKLELHNIFLLDHTPSESFMYRIDECGYDTSNYLEHVKITNVDKYGGSFSFSGILKINNGADFVEFGEAELYNEIDYYFLKSDSHIWCKYVLESYRFYIVNNFQTAYLMLFISLDSLIELIVVKLMEFCQREFQNLAILKMKNCTKKQVKYPVTEFINTCLIKDPLNNTLIQLNNKKRKLIEHKLDQILELCSGLSKKQRGNMIKKLTFFEKIRNTLAHGNIINLEGLKEEFSIAQKYIVDDEIRFDELFIGLLIEIMELLKKVCGSNDVFEFKKH